MRFPNVVRRIFDPLTDRIPVPVVGGLNRGRLWSLASAGSGYGTGRRAAGQMRFLAGLMEPGDVFWDVGAHHGYVSLMASRRVGPGGEVHAFEPGARNGTMLRRHLRWNRVGNARVHPVALGSFDGETSFGGGVTSKMHAIGRGDERVEVRTAVSLAGREGLRAPDVVKIDVEGAEADVLEGSLDLFPATVRLVIAMHSREADQACTALLGARGYTLAPSAELERARSGSGPWPGDPDLLAVGPAGGAAAELADACRFMGLHQNSTLD